MTALYQPSDAHRELNSDETPLSYRDDFVRDYGRVVHSASFRRLQGKTQVFPGHESDFFRNRLTHSLEVAQIAEGIAAKLNETDGFKTEQINERICATAALLHDLGHPPFGHNGERALDDQMKKHGGFEGNAQTLRIIARLEKKEVNDDKKPFGLNLTSRVVASILKYDRIIPLSRKPEAKLVKGYYKSEEELVSGVKRNVGGEASLSISGWKTLECSIMDLADDIAYSTFDLEDAFKAGFLNPLKILSSPEALIRVVEEKVREELSEELVERGVEPLPAGFVIKVFSDIFGKLIKPRDFGVPDETSLLDLAVEGYRASIAAAEDGQIRTALSSQLVKDAIASVVVDYNKVWPALSKARLDIKARIRVEVLKQYVFHATIYSSTVKLPEFRGYEVVQGIFRALSSPKGYLLMPEDVKTRYEAANEDLNGQMRVICDFVAGMTDRYALEFYGRLHSDTAQSMFKPI